MVPTETVYGLVARPTRELVAKIFELKRRPPEKSVQLLIPGIDHLERLGVPSRSAKTLADGFWPGPLTLVVEAREGAPDALVEGGRIGLRVPGHPIALDVLARCGPLAASSANRSGEETPADIEGVREIFGSDVDGYVDGGHIVGVGSTVVDVSGERALILREGPISSADVNGLVWGRFERP